MATIIEKIRALIKLSESTHSKAEKETAASTAQRLITEHQISQAELADSVKEKEEDDLEGRIIYESGRVSLWKQNLAFGIAKLNNTYCLSFSGVRSDVGHKRGTRLRIFGKPTDLELSIYMFNHLKEVIYDLSTLYVPGGKSRGVNPERESWSLGCVAGFLDKMGVAKKEVLALVSMSTAMVLANRPEEIKSKLETEKNITIGHKAASKSTVVQDIYASGFRKGQTLTVSRALKS